MKNIPVFSNVVVFFVCLNTEPIQSFSAIELILLTLFLQMNVLTNFILFHFPHTQDSRGCVWGGRVCLATGQQGSLNGESHDPPGLSFGVATVILSTLLSGALFFTLYSTIN